MKTNLDRVTLMILAALGLPLGCAVGPGSIDTGNESSSNSGDGDGDAETSGTGETGEPPLSYACENPTPIMQAGTDTPSGFVRCDDGFVHRVEAVECLAPQGEDAPTCAEFPGSCGTAADCVDGAYGSCSDNGFEGCVCSYGCASDADCDAGYVCACAGVVGDKATCIPGGCETDDSCGEGLCGLSTYEGCCGNSHSVACAAANEECHVDADCDVDLCDPGFPDGGSIQHICSSDGEAWTCGPPGWCNCDCGRPFFVDGEARVASTVARRDWSRRLTPREVDPDIRAALVDYWTEVGQFEHASVASFARFCMQLLALGAPPSLLADTQAALADEIEHARLAFGLASAYAGAAIGPGPLDVGSSVSGADRFAIVEGLIVEACVGETLAAIEASEAATQARDSVVAALLAQIAADELRHAQLGWRALRWILDRGDDALRRFAARTLADAIAIVEREVPQTGRRPALREHGVLDDALRAEVRAAAIAKVVRPAAAALVQRTDGSSARQAGRVGAHA